MESKQVTFTELFSAAAFRFAQATAWYGQTHPLVRSRAGEGYRFFRSSTLPKRVADAAAISRMLEVARGTDERLHESVRLLSEVAHAYARDVAREQGRWVGVHARMGVVPSDEQGSDDLLRIAHLDHVRHAARAHEVAMSELLSAATTMTFKTNGMFVRAMGQFQQNRFLEALNMATAEMALAAVYPDALDLTALPNADDPFWRELENYRGRPLDELQQQGRPADVLGGRWNGEEFRLFQFCGAAVWREAFVTSHHRHLAKQNPFGFDDKRTMLAIDSMFEKSEKELASLRLAGTLAPMPRAVQRSGSIEAAFTKAAPLELDVLRLTSSRAD